MAKRSILLQTFMSCAVLSHNVEIAKRTIYFYLGEREKGHVEDRPEGERLYNLYVSAHSAIE